MRCEPCSYLSGKLTHVPPHASMIETERRAFVAQGWEVGVETIYACANCDTVMGRNADTFVPFSCWVCR